MEPSRWFEPRDLRRAALRGLALGPLGGLLFLGHGPLPALAAAMLFGLVQAGAGVLDVRALRRRVGWLERVGVGVLVWLGVALGTPLASAQAVYAAALPHRGPGGALRCVVDGSPPVPPPPGLRCCCAHGLELERGGEMLVLLAISAAVLAAPVLPSILVRHWTHAQGRAWVTVEALRVHLSLGALGGAALGPFLGLVAGPGAIAVCLIAGLVAGLLALVLHLGLDALDALERRGFPPEVAAA